MNNDPTPEQEAKALEKAMNSQGLCGCGKPLYLGNACIDCAVRAIRRGLHEDSIKRNRRHRRKRKRGY